jgi:hypothetical protein
MAKYTRKVILKLRKSSDGVINSYSYQKGLGHAVGRFSEHFRLAISDSQGIPVPGPLESLYGVALSFQARAQGTVVLVPLRIALSLTRIDKEIALSECLIRIPAIHAQGNSH